MEECRFCQIVAGERDTYVIADTTRTVAFLDEHPASVGHTLVVPKPHHEFLFTDEEISEAVWQTARRVVTAMYETIEPDGISMFHTTGALAGNITHAHVHLVPRYNDDDISIRLARVEFDDEDSKEIARHLRDSL